MEDTTVFRAKAEPTPQEVSEVKGEPAPQITVSEHTERPLEVSEYIKELWKVGEAENHFEMPSLLKEINEFVLSEIERNKMESNRKSYEEVVENYTKRLKLPDGIDVYTKTEQIAELMRIDARILKLAQEKEDLLKKDITDLTSKQLKERFGL